MGAGVHDMDGHVLQGQIEGAEAARDYEMAEAFRRSKEVSVLENVPALYLTTEMQTDIRDNGLPYLGSVGKRLRH